MTSILATDPRSGETTDTGLFESPSAEVDQICQAAKASNLPTSGRVHRAELLRAVATALETHREALVALADTETGLGAARLSNEMTRTVFQFRAFAEMLDTGGYAEPIIEPAAQTEMGPSPDLRRILVPLGPVAVFGASNFPFAFSVPGGDTAAALAAGCPVVAKAHPSHPLTSQRCADLMAEVLERAGNHKVFQIVHGQQAGGDLVMHPEVKAVAFTGSFTAGMHLFRLAAGRPEPIPFFGELGSLNPVIITPGAALARADEIADGLFLSFTGSSGQLCTKPGLVLVPAGHAGERLRLRLAEATRLVDAGPLLNGGIYSAFAAGSERLKNHPGVRVLASSQVHEGRGLYPSALLVQVAVEDLSDELTEECFGPTTILADYKNEDDAVSCIERLAGSLTGTIHAEDSELPFARRLISSLERRVGRVVWNGYPTGVAVTASMTHGGPFPASTNSMHSSVGLTSVRRFMRPVSYQNVPAFLLPEDLTGRT
jgi:NADP-dependent aldehyde dehydrogenase